MLPFWIIVLLNNPSVLEFQGVNRWPGILFQDFLESRIHSSFNYGSPRPSHYQNHVWLMIWYSFTTDEMGLNLPETSVCVSSIHRVFFQKSWEPSICLLANIMMVPLVFFLVSGEFLLGPLPWIPFLSSPFLIIKFWTLTLTEVSEVLRSLDDGNLVV